MNSSIWPFSNPIRLLSNLHRLLSGRIELGNICIELKNVRIEELKNVCIGELKNVCIGGIEECLSWGIESGTDMLRLFVSCCTLEMVQECIQSCVGQSNVRNDLVKSVRDTHHAATPIHTILRLFQGGLKPFLACSECVCVCLHTLLEARSELTIRRSASSFHDPSPHVWFEHQNQHI
jgi:hypothetical protein